MDVRRPHPLPLVCAAPEEDPRLFPVSPQVPTGPGAPICVLESRSRAAVSWAPLPGCLLTGEWGDGGGCGQG